MTEFAVYETLATGVQTLEGNRWNVSLVHRTAGMHPAGSRSVHGSECWIIRIKHKHDDSPCTYGQMFSRETAAWAEFRKRVPAV